MNEVTIVIPCFNRVDLTEACLGALAKSVGEDVNYQVVIVDNGSTDGTGELLARLEGDVEVLHNDQNMGFARACNRGAQSASGSLLLFLNNDTVTRDGWLEALLFTAHSEPEIGILGAKLCYPTGAIQHAGVVFAGRSESKFFRFRDALIHWVSNALVPYHIYNGFDADLPFVNRAREFQSVTAACMLVRRTLFEALGGFDTVYWNGFEDVDFCLRARDLGWRAVYCPQSEVIHYESQTPGRTDLVAEQQNFQVFLSRWGDRVRPDDDEFYRADGFSIASLRSQAMFYNFQGSFYTWAGGAEVSE